MLLPKLMRRLFALDVADPTLDLPVAQLRVCNILFDASRSMTSLSHELGISLSAITQLADRLERVGMVERVAEQDDRRVRLLQLTERARQALQARTVRRVTRVQHVLEHMSPDAREEILRAFAAILQAEQSGCSSVPATMQSDVSMTG
jgi:DNA-binding MarR family transcriptional regulator